MFARVDLGLCQYDGDGSATGKPTGIRARPSMVSCRYDEQTLRECCSIDLVSRYVSALIAEVGKVDDPRLYFPIVALVHVPLLTDTM